MLAAEKARLNKLDIDLRAEADEFLSESGLGEIISDAGFAPVGSYTTKTMVWRDLDFERMVDEPDWQDHWILGQQFASTGFVWRFSCIDAYCDHYSPDDDGYYWGLRASRPDGPIWKLDLWTARPAEFAPGNSRRTTWNSLITEESRLNILAIKEAVYSHPEYRKTLLSVHIYEAVLENQVRSIDEFWQWWKSNYALVNQERRV